MQMKMKLTIDEATGKARELMHQGHHCGPSVLQVMWEAYGLKNEDFLWASTALWGGIAGQQQATCGAVSSAAVCLGLRHRSKLSDKDKAEKARKAAIDEAGELVKEFIGKFGAVTCFGLIEFDLTTEEGLKQAKESGVFENNCPKQVRFVIEKLYQLEEKRDSAENH
jgi:C_GCAxxG_C_C family probable redox protein